MASAPAPAAAPSTPAAPAAPAPGVTPAAPAETSARGPLRPIPPPPPLPGVLPDADTSASPPDAADVPPVGARPRGPDGRFLSGDTATPSEPAVPDAGEHTQPQEPAETEPRPTKFKFAGREYDSQAQAEQAHRTLQGHFKPLMAVARSLGDGDVAVGLSKITPSLERAAESARGWKARAEHFEAELAKARNGTSVPPASTPAPENPTAPAAEAVDWELYAEIRKLADAKGESWKAEQWLAEQNERILQSRLEKLLSEKLAPFESAQQRAAVGAQTETLFSQLATYTNTDGTPAFPELHDETAAFEVGQLWASLGLPREFALTPQGAVAAIAMYRMGRSAASRLTSSDTASPATVQPSAATVSTPAPPSDAAAAAAIGDGRVRPVSAGTADGPSAEAARILAGLRSVNNGNRNMLGFDA